MCFTLVYKKNYISAHTHTRMVANILLRRKTYAGRYTGCHIGVWQISGADMYRIDT